MTTPLLAWLLAAIVLVIVRGALAAPRRPYYRPRKKRSERQR